MSNIERNKDSAARPESSALLLLKREATYRKRIDKGAFIYRPGEPADPLYIVEDGMVKLTVSSASGRDLTLGLFGPGEIFGEEAVFERADRISFAIAAQPSTILAVPRQRVHELLERQPSISLFLTRALAARFKDSVRQMENLAWSSVPTRLAQALLRLARRRGVAEPAGTRVDLRLTHQELADLIGSTRETTTATLNDFRRRGLIEFVKRQIVLLRPDQLSSLALGRS